MLKQNRPRTIEPPAEDDDSNTNHYSFRTFLENRARIMATNFRNAKSKQNGQTNIMKQRNENRFQTNQIITKRIQQSNLQIQEQKDMQPLTNNEMKRFIRYPKKPQMMGIERPKNDFEKRKIIVPKQAEGPRDASRVISANSPNGISAPSRPSTSSPSHLRANSPVVKSSPVAITKNGSGINSNQKIGVGPGTSSMASSANSPVVSSGQSSGSTVSPSFTNSEKQSTTSSPGATGQSRAANSKSSEDKALKSKMSFSNSEKQSTTSSPGAASSIRPNALINPSTKTSTQKERVGPGISSSGRSLSSQVVDSGLSRPSTLSPSPLLHPASTTTVSLKEALSTQANFSPSPVDRALLAYLLQMKYMTMDQVDRKFLGNQQSAQSFRNLLAGGYIKCKDGSPHPESLLVPTDKAYELLKIENPGKEIPKPIKRVFEPELNHDLKLVEIRMKFEQLNFIDKWFSESMLEVVPVMKEIFTDLPDAVCKKKNEKGYFLELEISQKSFKRYEERILLYEQALKKKEIIEAGIEGVIFLCTDPKVFGIIKERLPKTRNFSVLMLSRYLKEKAA